ncbi:hypothetical protein [Krasilnikovia sp. MM14-A1004]|uniref:hypothetical protein n=1 Tax=Krasilnikovia sp. MM14-A1004 TaxID=3373541 RepID=UPI00399C6436
MGEKASLREDPVGCLTRLFLFGSRVSSHEFDRVLLEELVELVMASDFVDTACGLVAGNVAVTPFDGLHIFSDRLFDLGEAGPQFPRTTAVMPPHSSTRSTLVNGSQDSGTGVIGLVARPPGRRRPPLPSPCWRTRSYRK